MAAGEGSVVPPPRQRNTAPRVRKVGSRIYDSVNGKTCHQCRQKTLDLVVACKFQRISKRCPIMYCHKCLWNRYGERAEEVAGLEQWTCPKCRAICNCSFCMRKRNEDPTGIAAKKAKAKGFSSVAEMLLKTTPQERAAEKAHLSGEGSTSGEKKSSDPNTRQKRKPDCGTKHEPEGNGSCALSVPEGEVVSSVGGVDLPTEDAGNAIQFMQFCATYGEVLDIKEEQAKHILQDIYNVITGREGNTSPNVLFHINLLSHLLEHQGEESVEISPSDGENSWFDALKEFLSASQSVLKSQRIDSLENTDDYDTFTASEKLRLLNILCDEALATEKLRSWMEEDNAKLASKVKEAKRRINAAMDMEKQLKRKMKDDIAQAISDKEDSPLSISEHEAVVSVTKSEMELARAEVLESKAMLPKKTKNSDAVRTEPILVGSGGHVYWKLNCLEDSEVLHQNIGNGDSLTLDEKWFTINDEGKEAVEKHAAYASNQILFVFTKKYVLCSSMKRRRPRRNLKRKDADASVPSSDRSLFRRSGMSNYKVLGRLELGKLLMETLAKLAVCICRPWQIRSVIFIWIPLMVSADLCRQKTLDLVVACKFQRINKPCPIMYCHKCLWNRYGERGEEVAGLEQWTCPKCRGICNCSFCMKKRNEDPTGIAAKKAKARGFSSVAEMLLKTTHQERAAEKARLSGEGCTSGEKQPNETNNTHQKRKLDSGKKHEYEGNGSCDLPLPEGEAVGSVGGVDVPTEDAGNAIQFMSFCSTFGEVFDVNKKQAELILRDIYNVTTGCKGEFSPNIHFHINLLSHLLEDQGKESVEISPSDGENSWFDALKEFLSASQSVLKSQRIDSLENTDDYDTFTASEKLRLLNILCDEALVTEKVRSWILENNAKLTSKVKEAKEKINAAMEKEKQLKQKMKDDIAQAISAKGGALLSIAERKATVSGTKSELEQARAEVLESKAMLPKETKNSDAVRTEPILVGSGGHVYWKLNCLGDSEVLHQNIGNGDSLTLDEKWFTINGEGKEVIEKNIAYASSIKRRRLRGNLRRKDADGDG
ncbi:uncharacterized protein LOC127240492 [Andrographis paniculata]|uniref:uncharacterized protein LOC127240492 n=1 Tax=Andrographis paniculata TaxID=175694 RepID=UPI0021E85887|nr:uncharacterized protein LOC127240492 [Andrographis paniculata]